MNLLYILNYLFTYLYMHVMQNWHLLLFIYDQHYIQYLFLCSVTINHSKIKHIFLLSGITTKHYIIANT